MGLNKEFLPTRSRYLVITRDYLLPLLFIIFGLFLWWLSFFSPAFTLQNIICQLDYEPCTGENLLAELAKYQGTNLFRLDDPALSARLTSADFTLRQAEIRKILPHTLALSLQSVYPTVAAKLETEATWIIFDEQFRVIGTRTVDPNVPTLTASSLTNLVVGSAPQDQTLLDALKLTRALSAAIPNIQGIKIVDSLIYLSLPDYRQAIMSTELPQATQIQSLQAVLANATILSGISTIDVRFSQPVLR
ncbi:MAG: hypothetical protein UX82_C0034G0003 [Microgenomates group bacterium GW2011_GWE1_47_12]|nr:MAG: hypothetical protein UX82_C0034G0003 [Microgenomates group bacterium GW2011_GWE1_47_12]KKU60199.1 MAG: hypothetical protein UX84_C0033G0003 [Microgenomates group bacterium GW2011_GWD1_47_13]